jgi:Ras-related protein Rab-23
MEDFEVRAAGAASMTATPRGHRQGGAVCPPLLPMPSNWPPPQLQAAFGALRPAAPRRAPASAPWKREVKVLVVGNGGAGKTSLIKRFCSGTFADAPSRTIGVDFLERLLPVATLGQDVRLFCWDTAGQEEYDALTQAYYRGAGAAVIVFSTTDRASFDAVPAWRRKLLAECGDIAVVLVQNKVDLLDRCACRAGGHSLYADMESACSAKMSAPATQQQPQASRAASKRAHTHPAPPRLSAWARAVVSSEEAEEMARRLGLKFYRSCVKEGLNVTEGGSGLQLATRHRLITPGAAGLWPASKHGQSGTSRPAPLPVPVLLMLVPSWVQYSPTLQSCMIGSWQPASWRAAPRPSCWSPPLPPGPPEAAPSSTPRPNRSRLPWCSRSGRRLGKLRVPRAVAMETRSSRGAPCRRPLNCSPASGAARRRWASGCTRPRARLASASADAEAVDTAPGAAPEPPPMGPQQQLLHPSDAEPCKPCNGRLCFRSTYLHSSRPAN